MASVASRPRALPRVGSFPSGVAVPVMVVLGLMAFALWHHTRALGQALWMDEGLSIGIASQPLLDIPHVLRVDGSPPLYNMLLGVWTRLVGDGAAEGQGRSVAVPPPAGRGAGGEPGAVRGDLPARRARRPVGGLEPVRAPRRLHLRRAVRLQ